MNKTLFNKVYFIGGIGVGSYASAPVLFASDLVISRVGAGTISELSLTGRPCSLVPSPNMAEDHQTKNALAEIGLTYSEGPCGAECYDMIFSRKAIFRICRKNIRLMFEYRRNPNKPAMFD